MRSGLIMGMDIDIDISSMMTDGLMVPTFSEREISE